MGIALRLHKRWSPRAKRAHEGDEYNKGGLHSEELVFRILELMCMLAKRSQCLLEWVQERQNHVLLGSMSCDLTIHVHSAYLGNYFFYWLLAWSWFVINICIFIAISGIVKTCTKVD